MVRVAQLLHDNLQTDRNSTRCKRLIDYCRENEDEATAAALEAWRARHDPFEMKAWIESKLKQIWDLDRQLREDEDSDETEKEERAAAAVLKSNLRSDSSSEPQTPL